VTPEQILAALHAHQATLLVEGGDLRIRAPAPLPAALVEALHARKPALLRLLGTGGADDLVAGAARAGASGTPLSSSGQGGRCVPGTREAVRDDGPREAAARDEALMQQVARELAAARAAGRPDLPCATCGADSTYRRRDGTWLCDRCAGLPEPRAPDPALEEEGTVLIAELALVRARLVHAIARLPDSRVPDATCARQGAPPQEHAEALLACYRSNIAAWREWRAAHEPEDPYLMVDLYATVLGTITAG
jgi:hypothetical protein